MPASIWCPSAAIQCRTVKLDKFGNGFHSNFHKILILPLCSEWQNTSKNTLLGFSHDFLRVANLFGRKFRRLIPDLGGSDELVSSCVTHA